jgi:hypothetical protein
MAVNDGRSDPVPGRAGAVPWIVSPEIANPTSTGLGGSPGAQSPALGQTWDSQAAGADLGVIGISADPYASGQNPHLPTADVHAGDVNVPGQIPDTMPLAGTGLAGTGAEVGNPAVVIMPHPNSKGVS